jgi:hypothetical protein
MPFVGSMDPKNTTPPSKDIFVEERVDALANLFAEGLLYLSEHGQLTPDLIVPSEEGKCVTVPERP